jgi:predicted dehydrogenase
LATEDLHVSDVRLGIIGAGAISGYACRDLAAHPEVRIVAVADVSEPRRESLASRYRIERTFATPEALLEDDGIDAVYIAVPNVHHAPVALAALAAGKHALLEKPFAFDHGAALEVAAAAARSGKVFMVGMNQRFERVAQKTRLLVESGRLGDVYHVQAFWQRRAGIPRIGSWFGNKSIAGGGALLDIGVHMLDLSLHLVGNFRPVTVSGATYTRFGNRGLGDGAWGLSERVHGVFDVDDFATALIRLDGGTTVSLTASWAAHQEQGNAQDVVLYGTEGSAAVYADRLYRAGDVPGEYVTVQGPAAGALPYPHASRFHHFVNVVLGTETAAIPVSESLAVQRILDAVYESATAGREVALDASCWAVRAAGP